MGVELEFARIFEAGRIRHRCTGDGGQLHQSNSIRERTAGGGAATSVWGCGLLGSQACAMHCFETLNPEP